MGLILLFLALCLLACDPVDVYSIKIIIILLSGYVLMSILGILRLLEQPTLLASRFWFLHWLTLLAKDLIVGIRLLAGQNVGCWLWCFCSQPRRHPRTLVFEMSWCNWFPILGSFEHYCALYLTNQTNLILRQSGIMRLRRLLLAQTNSLNWVRIVWDLRQLPQVRWIHF